MRGNADQSVMPERLIEVYRHDAWVAVQWREIKAGDRFRTADDGEEQREYQAETDAYRMPLTGSYVHPPDAPLGVSLNEVAVGEFSWGVTAVPL